MLLDHRLLHRVKPSALGEVFHRDDVGAVGLAGQQDAGIHRLIDEAVAAAAPQHHGAGAAVAFGATFLGAGRALVEAQIIEQCERR